jgi:hypothetical protein
MFVFASRGIGVCVQEMLVPLVFYIAAHCLYRLAKIMCKQNPTKRPPRTAKDMTLYMTVAEEYDALYIKRREGGHNPQKIKNLRLWTVVPIYFLYIVYYLTVGGDIVPEVGGGTISNKSSEEGVSNTTPIFGEEVGGGTISNTLLERGPILGLSMSPCLPPDPTTEYCFFRDLWKMPPPTTTPTPTQRSYFIDDMGDLYYTTYEVGHVPPLLVRERDVINALMAHTKDGCICPSVLGINDNTHYLLYKDIYTGMVEWTIMNDIVVERVVGGGDTVVSFNSIHYHPHPNITTRLNEFSEKILYYHHHYNTSEGILPTIVHQIPQEYVKRITVHLYGEDAVCFNQCCSSSSSSAIMPFS